MPYPDIKDPHVAEEMTFFHYLPEILLVITAPVWGSVLLVIGFEDLWFSIWLSILITLGVACLVAGFLPQSALTRLANGLGLRGKSKLRS